jgi:hypothetical protein
MSTQAAMRKAEGVARVGIGGGAGGKMRLGVLAILNRGFSSSGRMRLDFTHAVSSDLYCNLKLRLCRTKGYRGEIYNSLFSFKRRNTGKYAVWMTLA